MAVAVLTVTPLNAYQMQSQLLVFSGRSIPSLQHLVAIGTGSRRKEVWQAYRVE